MNPIQQRVLVFDVETNGLLPRKPNCATVDGANTFEGVEIHKLPHILQLSFAVYDTITGKIIKTYNRYIRPPSEIPIPAKITEINGISRELVDKMGCDIVEVLTDFYEWYSECDAIVAHNLEFDSRMVLLETKRNYARLVAMDKTRISEKDEIQVTPYICWMFNPKYCELTDIRLICTMQMSIDLCNIQRVNSRGSYKKFPTLCELYKILFDQTPENLHNSMVDVLVCLRCFLELEFKRGISDEMFSNYLQTSL
jgi:DNA polymerase III epsilon subunit-like protein